MSDLPRVNNLFHEFATADVVTATKNPEAFANEVFDITTSDDQHYFMKILGIQHPDSVANEAKMQQRLLAAGLQTPEYIEIKPGSYLGQHGNEKFVLSKYIPGSSPKTVTPRLVESLGETLAILHNCLDGITVPESYMQWLSSRVARADIAPYHGEKRAEIDSLLDYGETIFEADLPQAVTHGDLWLSNVFAEGDEVTAVFDLETAEKTVRIVDLARTYTSVRFNSDYSAEQVVAGLAKGYNAKAEQPLTVAEMQNMFRAIAWVSGACAVWHAVQGRRYRDPYIKLGLEAMEK